MNIGLRFVRSKQQTLGTQVFKNRNLTFVHSFPKNKKGYNKKRYKKKMF